MARAKRSSVRRTTNADRSVQADGREVSRWIAFHGWDSKFSVRERGGKVVFTMSGKSKTTKRALRDLRDAEQKSRTDRGLSLGERLARAGVVGTVASGVGDLSTNKAHMKGFGRD